MWLVLIHALGLGGLLSWTLWKIRRDRLLSVAAAFVLGWTNVVVTAFILSCISALSNHIAYVGVSLALAVIFGWAARAFFDLEPRPVVAYPDLIDRREKHLRAFLWLSIAIVVVPTAALCLTYHPDNYDSVAYRMPRAFLYLSQGTLRQLSQADFRMQFYPFNMTLAYLASSIGGLAGPTLNVFGFITWLVGGASVARIAREFGAGRNAELFAAAAYLAAPAVLVSASSTNDDMIAGVPLVIGLLFLARWWRSCTLIDAILAAMGCGLSAGSKLHFPFFFPVALLFGVFVAGRWLIDRHPIHAFGRRAYHTILATIIVIVLGTPALIINVIETGRATPDLQNYQNKPFSLVAAATTTAVSSASLFLAPIPDLDLDPLQGRRKKLYDAFNNLQNKTLFAWVSPRLNYSNEPYYRFDGVASNDAYQGVWEQSAWLGFAPWLLLSVPFLAWSRRTQVRTPAQSRARSAALWLTAAFFGWHIARCFVLKYVGAAGIYYAYPMAIGAPALAWIWDLSAVSIARLACYGLLATNLLSALNAFLYNQQRNIPEMLAAPQFRPHPDVVDADLAAHLRGSKNTLIAYTQWELPVLDLIAVQPRAHYTMIHQLGAAPRPGYDLSVMLDRENVDYGEAPFQFADDDRARLSFLGSMHTVWGDQRAFGHDIHGNVDTKKLDLASGRSEPAGVVFDYRAGQNASERVLASGWAPSDLTHHWSDGPESRITFYLPRESTGCVLEGKAITFGNQTIKPGLNGSSLEPIAVNGQLPGENFKIPLPDGILKHGEINDLMLRYEHLRTISRWKVALGLVQATLRCQRLKFSQNEILPPLRPDGFAIMQFAERRGENGGLTGFSVKTVNGSDPSETFEISVTYFPFERNGAKPSSPIQSPLEWNKWIEIPEAPTDGFLRIVLTRTDRPQTSAHFSLPVMEGSTVDLDTRRLPSGQVLP